MCPPFPEQQWCRHNDYELNNNSRERNAKVSHSPRDRWLDALWRHRASPRIPILLLSAIDHQTTLLEGCLFCALHFDRVVQFAYGQHYRFELMKAIFATTENIESEIYFAVGV